MTQFETAQIANLCPVDSEEAKSIVPRYATSTHCPLHSYPLTLVFSLVKIDDDKLQALLDEIQTMRRFQS